jgi:hypothetical protein
MYVLLIAVCPFFWSLRCLFFFDIRILIASMVSSNSSFEIDRKSELQEATGKCGGKLSELTSKSTL